MKELRKRIPKDIEIPETRVTSEKAAETREKPAGPAGNKYGQADPGK